jgi:hypothetical protein
MVMWLARFICVKRGEVSRCGIFFSFFFWIRASVVRGEYLQLYVVSFLRMIESLIKGLHVRTLLNQLSHVKTQADAPMILCAGS